tara:strand:+ start:14969 stop:15700 length:732 start_codon:yes stop_codon:yes gene_type:complete
MNSTKESILITGSSKGIGLAIANHLKDKSLQIIVNSRKKNKAITELIKNKNFFYLMGDASNPRFSDKIKKFILKNNLNLKYLICNVGLSKQSKNKFENSSFKKLININLYSATNIILNLTPIFKKNRSKIICISSIASDARLNSPIGYSVGKNSLNQFVKCYSRYYSENKTFICSLLIGHTIHENSVWKKKSKKTKELVLKTTPNKKFVNTSQISQLVEQILLNNNNLINGSVINCEEGFTHF